MKILSIGDFHGKLPNKLMKQIKKENPDIIVSVGDYPSFTLKKEFFKHSWGNAKQIWEVIGKKKTKQAIKKDWKNAEKVMKKLETFKIPVLTTLGNYESIIADSFDIHKTYLKDAKKWEWYEQDFFAKALKKFKNIKRIDYKHKKFRGLIFIGGYGHTIPGKVKSKNFKKYKSKLDRLFKKFKKENKQGKIIFVMHNMPYKCLDKITDKNAPKQARGQHYGSKLNRRIIEQHQPILAIGGHIHENQGKKKIGKTTVINNGAAYENKATIIYFDEEKGRIKKIKFLK
jgi:Icc-related predicted phosphoesterase